MKHLVFTLAILIPSLGYSQEVKNKDGLCYRIISGVETHQTPADALPILIQCFDGVLAQCALEDSFSDCLESSNQSIMEALTTGHKKFDQTSLQSDLPGRRNSWEEFETNLSNLKSMVNLDTDSQVSKFRALFVAVMKLNDLRWHEK